MAGHERKVLVISYTNHARDPRVHRQIEALRDHCELYTAGTGPAESMTQRHTQLSKKQVSLFAKLRRAAELKLGMVERYYWGTPIMQEAKRKLEDTHFDLVIANDLETLPLALVLSDGRSRVYVDAHEYEPKHMDDRWMFRFFMAPYWDGICRRYLPKADYMTTVAGLIAREYEKEYGVSCDLLFNAPAFESLEPSRRDDGRIRIIHHGGASASRRMESLVELMDHLDDRFTLDLMLVPCHDETMDKLREMARQRDNVKFVDPVPMPEIARRINQYDIGIHMLWPGSFNNLHALPNKFFEFIQARLCIAIWPSPEMKRIVDEYHNGVVAEEFSVESMAQALNALSDEDILRMKMNSASAAAEFNAEKSMAKLRAIVDQLLEPQTGTGTGK